MSTKTRRVLLDGLSISARESLFSASTDRDSTLHTVTSLQVQNLYYSKRAAPHARCSPAADERLLPKKPKHLLSHPIRKLMPRPTHDRNLLPPLPPDVQRLHEPARRRPRHDRVVRTCQHQHALPRKDGRGRGCGCVGNAGRGAGAD